jgi:uncharacterized protein (TIRG00374 family)
LSFRRLFPFLRRWFSLLLGVAIVGWGAWYVFGHPSEIAAIRQLSPGWLLLLFGLSMAKLAAMGAFTKIIVASFDIDLAGLEWFGLSAMSAMGNYLTPFRGGAAIRAVYLKSKYGLPYSLFLSTLSTLYVLTFATSAALGLLAALGLYFRFRLFDRGMLLLFLSLFLMPVLLLFLVRLAPPLSNRLGRRAGAVTVGGSRVASAMSWALRALNRVVEGWQVISSRPAVLARLVVASFVNAGVTLLMIHFSFAAFAVRLPLLSSLFMISSMIPVTPSGLGVAELMVVLVAEGFVADSSLSILAAGLNRTVMILSSVAWGMLFTHVLGRRTLSTGGTRANGVEE